jgi:hypothetical protein
MEAHMNHRITLDVARLDAYYEKMMDEVYLLHHTYPTNLTHINMTDADLVEYGEYDAVGRGLAASLQHQSNRKRKKVYFQSDPDYCNGLPRNR